MKRRQHKVAAVLETADEMLPPIHKSTNGLPNDRRSSGYGGELHKKDVAASLGLPVLNHVGFTEPNGRLANNVSDKMAERVHALERDNEYFREELQHLRHLYSSNQQQHDNDKLSVGSIVDDLQRLATSFNNKLQADVSQQQREQQKSALLFAEVSRLGHRVEGLESELRSVVDDTHRRLEAHEQHAQFMASLSSKQASQQLGSPGRNAETQRQLKDMQDAMLQLRSEMDSDRNTRWKIDAAVDAKLDAHLERLNAKLAADKRDLARLLEEQRQLVTGADFQRVTTHMREFTRLSDHLLAMERWLHGEFGQVKRLFQAFAGDVDARFQSLLLEIANCLKAWHAAQTRQEEDFGARLQDLEAATRAVALTIQRKLLALEEVVPLEVQARQKNDDKLRRRIEGVVKALGHAIETSRAEFLPHQAALVSRVHQLELNQQSAFGQVQQETLENRVRQLELDQQSVLGQVDGQHSAMRDTIETFMKDSDAMLAKLADTIEQERTKVTQLAMVPVTSPAPTPTISTDEIRAETRRVKEDLDALQEWTAKHAQECRQFFDFLSWSMEESQRENVVALCLDAVLDQVVETQVLEQIQVLGKRASGALRHFEKPKAMSCASSQTKETSFSTADNDRDERMPIVSVLDDEPLNYGVMDEDVDVSVAAAQASISTAEPQPLANDALPDALSLEINALDTQQFNDEDSNYSSMDTTQYSVDFEQLAGSPVRQEELAPPHEPPIVEETTPAHDADQDEPSMLEL